MGFRNRRSAVRLAVQHWLSAHRQPPTKPPLVEPLEPRTLFGIGWVIIGIGSAEAAGRAVGGDPVSLASGTLVLNTTDFQSTGFGSPWGVSRSWTNNPAYQLNQNVGNGWQMNQNPQMLEPEGSTGPVEIVTSGSTADWFENTGSGYTEYFGGYDHLTYNSSNDIYTLTDSSGNQTGFYGSSYTSYPGTFASYQPASGSLITVTSHSGANITEEQRSETVGGVTTTDSMVYTYYPSGGANAGELENVALNRSTGGTTSTIRQVQYTYYGSGDSNGNLNDLQTATEEDGSGNPLAEDYYRYYLSTSTCGDQLQYEFTATDVARMETDLPPLGENFLTAPSTDEAQYATLNLSYGSALTVYPAAPSDSTTAYSAYLYPVATEYVAGVGSTAEGGIGEYSFTYTPNTTFADAIIDGSLTLTPDGSGTAAQFNQPAIQTVVTEPDGLVNTYDLNYAGQTIVERSAPTSGSDRYVGSTYNAQARLTEQYDSLSIGGADMSTGDIDVWSASQGSTTVYTYFSGTTSANSSSAGNVNGRLESVSIGSSDSTGGMEQESYDYKSQTANGVTIYYVADDTVYQGSNGSGGETTSYLYSFSSGTFSPTELATTLPTITAAENGPNSAKTDTQLFDPDGNVVWEKDPDGDISFDKFDDATGAMTESIEDVNSTDAPSSPEVAMPSTWTLSTDALILVTTYVVDAEGRTTEQTDPNGNVTYTTYDDINHQTRVYPGWHAVLGTSDYTTTGPVQVLNDDWGLSYTEALTYAYTPSTAATPTGSDAIGTIGSLSRDQLNNSDQVTEEDNYFNLSGVTYNAGSVTLGTSGTNYYATTYTYDSGGRQNSATTPTGTVTDTSYDSFGEAIITSVGTTTGSMTEVSASAYDADGNLIETADYPGGNSSGRATVYFYNNKNQLTAEMTGAVESSSTPTGAAVADSGTGATDTFVSVYTLDNLGEATETDVYNDLGTTYTPPPAAEEFGYEPSTASMQLVAASTAGYDSQGNVFSSSVISVDPTTGDKGTADTTNNYYDADGNLIASIGPTGAATKSVYNGAGWNTATYITDGGQLNNSSNIIIGSSTAYAAAASVSDDVVLSQTQDVYDNDGSVIETITADRFGTDATTGTTAEGPLGTPSTTPYARVSYAASYFDAADRDSADVNVGTNGGSAWNRPSSAPTRSATALVTSYAYDSAGNLAFTTDPLGLISASGYDLLGRTLVTVADWTTSMGPVVAGSLPTPTDSSNQTTEYAYDGDSNITMMTAVMPSDETSQITHYLYGVSTALGSTIDDNDLLYEVQYPDPTTGTNSAPSGSTYNQSESYTYDGTGEQTGYTDRNGTAHAYSYDQLGRLTADQITTFGTGVDSTVARLGYAFNDAGLQSTATSYNASGGVLNQIADSYDGFGQLTNEYQEHDGSVDTDSSQAVSYSYDATNGDRPTSLTYPNGREVDYNYDSGLDSILSRISSVSDSLETMQVYTYLGLDTPVTFTDGNGVELSYLGTATSTGTGAGDQYAGLDRFGRITDQKWANTSTSATVDEFQYTYDADGNVLTKNNMVLSGDDESFTYDNLNRLTAFNVDTLDTESWSLDALGNWNSHSVNGATTSRTTSAQNQVKTVGSATLGYDKNGNTLTDNTGQQYVYDGWNRLVTVKNSSGTALAAYTYDAEGRRITQTEAGTTTDLYYSNRWRVIEEDVAGSATVQFTWGPFYVNQLIASDTFPTGISIGIGGGDDDPHGSGHGDDVSVEVAGRSYAEQDADYDVTSMTDDGGAVQERYQYDPTGNVTVLNPTGTVLGAGMNSSTIGQVIGYQGGWTDPISGLVTFQYRDLNTGLGRWIEQDPAGYVNGPNCYQIELSNTTGSVDPSGLDAIVAPVATSGYTATGVETGAAGTTLAGGTTAVGVQTSAAGLEGATGTALSSSSGSLVTSAGEDLAVDLAADEAAGAWLGPVGEGAGLGAWAIGGIANYWADNYSASQYATARQPIRTPTPPTPQPTPAPQPPNADPAPGTEDDNDPVSPKQSSPSPKPTNTAPDPDQPDEPNPPTQPKPPTSQPSPAAEDTPRQAGGDEPSQEQQEQAHRKGKSESTRQDHEQGEARQSQDQGGEKKDAQDDAPLPRKRPNGPNGKPIKGPWPPPGRKTY